MKIKTTLILLGAFLVLLVVAFFVINPFELGKREIAALFEDFNPDDAVKILIKPSGGEEQVLEKISGEWKVPKHDFYPADPEEVEALLSRVEGFKRDNISSTNPEKRSVFKVDESGIEVKLFGEAEAALTHFFVGKIGPEFVTTFIRKADSNEVIKAGGNLKFIFDKSDSTWRDRVIFKFDPENAVGIRLQLPDETISMVKEGGDWKITEPEEAPAIKAEVDSILEVFSSFEANEFEDEIKDPKEFELDNPKTVISVSLQGGSEEVLLIGKEDDISRNWVMKEGSDIIFIASTWLLEKMMKKLEDLKEEI